MRAPAWALVLVLFGFFLGMQGQMPAPEKPDLLAKIIPILKDNYYEPEAIQPKAEDTLQTFLRRLGSGVYLEPTATVSETSSETPLTFLPLPGKIIYLRTVSFAFSLSDQGMLEQKIQSEAVQKSAGLILDLRGVDDEKNFSGANQIADIFSSPGQTIFSLRGARKKTSERYRQTGTTRLYSGPVVVLVDGRTGGAAEALAASLKSAGALLFGQPTAGRGGWFKTYPLAEQTLHYAVAEVVLPSGRSLLGHSVHPDLAFSVDEATETKILAILTEKGPFPLITESVAFPRMNEAALAQNENPEIRDTEPAPTLPSVDNPQDIVLRHAIDSLHAVSAVPKK